MSEKREWVGLDDRKPYYEFLNGIEGGVISPGGAAILLGISRQAVHKAMDRGTLRYWSWREQAESSPEMDVSVRDVVEFGVRQGRIRSYEDCGIRGELVRREVERALGLTAVNS